MFKVRKKLVEYKHEETLSGYGHRIWTLISLSSDKIAFGGEDSTIRIWDIKHNKALKTLKGHSKQVRTLLKISENIIASGSSDSTIRIWNIRTGVCLKTLPGPTTHIWSLIRLSDGTLVSGNEDGFIRYWDIDSGTCKKSISVGAGYIWRLFYLPGVLSNKIAVGCRKDIKILDEKSGKCIQTLTGHTGYVRGFTLLSNDRLVSGSSDKNIKVWNLSNGKCLKTINMKGGAWPLITLPDGRIVGRSGGMVVVLDVDKNTQQALQVKNNGKAILSLCLSNDNRLVMGHYNISILNSVNQLPQTKKAKPTQRLGPSSGFIPTKPIFHSAPTLSIPLGTLKSPKIALPSAPKLPISQFSASPNPLTHYSFNKGYNSGQIQQDLRYLMSHPSVTSLDLSDIHLNQNTIASLRELLRVNNNIIFVDLSNTNIGNKEAQIIIKTLPLCVGLKHLDLSKNNFTNAQTRNLYHTCKKWFWERDRELTLNLKGNKHTCNFDELQVGDLLLKYNDGSLSNKSVMIGNKIHSFLYSKEKYIDISHAAIYIGHDDIIESTAEGIIKTNLIKNNKQYDVFRYESSQQIGKFAADIAFSLHLSFMDEQKERSLAGSLRYSKSGGYNWKVLLTSFVRTSKINSQLIKDVVVKLNLQGKRFYCSELVVFVYSLAAELGKQQSFAPVFPIDVGYKNILPVVLYHVLKRDKNWNCMGEIVPRTLYLERAPNFGSNYCKKWNKKDIVKPVPTTLPSLNLPNHVDVPEAFLCPITREIMLNAVIISSGVSYEKRAIQMWLQENNTCPRNMTTLPNKIITPNHALKNAISSWLRKISQPQTNQGRAIQLENQADQHYVNGKLYIQQNKKALAQTELMLAQMQYKKIQRNYRINFGERIKKIKLKLKQLLEKKE